MRPYGGFEHNLQSLRVVDVLEQRYPGFDGLNLLFETREGILKHCRPEVAGRLGDVGARFSAGHRPTVEAQIANLADEIAYNHHDIDDGLRSGILSVELVCEHPIFARVFSTAAEGVASTDGKRRLYTAIRSMLGVFVNDLIETSRAHLAASGCASPDDVRVLGRPAVDFTPEMRVQHLSLKRLLFRALYHDARVRASTRPPLPPSANCSTASATTRAVAAGAASACRGRRGDADARPGRLHRGRDRSLRDWSTSAWSVRVPGTSRPTRPEGVDMSVPTSKIG